MYFPKSYSKEQVEQFSTDVKRDVSADIASAKIWVENNLTEPISDESFVREVQNQFPSLINDEVSQIREDLEIKWRPEEFIKP